ncbi:ABC transporter substrate-binding protein [Shimia abyssi]|uniref:Iron(III) transport system substrate-binding protein n=1 Tax=Shimia abyssi TaxID=1662395 RepID=A0A2P8FHH2_9RHOB|nr:ABC transporter substrate-binding protein [Shimia abyssi]PSL21173.1 iron(III) transport system substrate-binding protein [Shimia abyssi]
MRNLVTLILCFLPALSSAQDWEDRQFFGTTSPTQTLRVLSSTDTALFEPIIDHFLQSNRDIAVEYLVASTADIDAAFRATPERFDVVISSAMDLQFKLVNDGYAIEIEDLPAPDWAQWRQSLFAFTAEPAAIILNRNAFRGHPIPRTRQELIQAMRARPDIFENRLGTYDVRQSALGYLFATQDARASETYWRLMEVMGSLGLRLYCCSGDMIDDLTRGDLVVAYNVLGSYAAARTENANVLEIILPSEFPTTMMRTAFVAAQTDKPETAASFTRFLVEMQQANSDHASFPLPPLNPAENVDNQSTIALGPALMTYLDTLKKRTFLQEWENAVLQ